MAKTQRAERLFERETSLCFLTAMRSSHQSLFERKPVTAHTQPKGIVPPTPHAQLFLAGFVSGVPFFPYEKAFAFGIFCNVYIHFQTV